MKNFLELFGLKKFNTSTYHPQGNSILERSHHNINEYIRLFLSDKKDEWDLHLQCAMFAYNNCPHSQTNIAPHELVFGNIARCPSEFPPIDKIETYDEILKSINKRLRESRLLAALNLNESKFKTKERYDKDAKTVHFHEGQLVMRKNEIKKGKHSPLFLGPFEIIKVNDKNTVNLLTDDGKIDTVHFDKIKHAY